MTDKLLVLEEFYAQKIWFLKLEDGKRIYGASIKVEPSGYLLVLKARSAEGPQVAFIGGGTLDGLRKKLLAFGGDNQPRWRQDKFALDRLGEN